MNLSWPGFYGLTHVVYIWLDVGAVHWKCLLPWLYSCYSVFSLREGSQGPDMHKSVILLYTHHSPEIARVAVLFLS